MNVSKWWVVPAAIAVFGLVWVLFQAFGLPADDAPLFLDWLLERTVGEIAIAYVFLTAFANWLAPGR